MALSIGFCVLAVPIVFAFTPPNGVQLAVLVLGGPIFAIVGSAMFPLSTLGADSAGVSHVTVTGLMGAAWAGGFTFVPVVIGIVADHTSDGTAYALIALVSLPVLAVLAQRVRRVAVPA